MSYRGHLDLKDSLYTLSVKKSLSGKILYNKQSLEFSTKVDNVDIILVKVSYD